MYDEMTSALDKDGVSLTKLLTLANNGPNVNKTIYC